MIGLSASMVSTVLLIGSGLFILLVASAGDWLFLSSEPFEAGFLDRLNDVFFAKPNVENGLTGLFPAIVGTLSLVMVMTLFVAPLGVATAIYLSEYARDTWYTKLIRISITNLAGVVKRWPRGVSDGVGWGNRKCADGGGTCQRSERTGECSART